MGQDETFLMRLDVGSTATLYRIIVQNDRTGFLNLHRELERLGGVIAWPVDPRLYVPGTGNAAVEAALREIHERREDLADVAERFQVLAMSGETLDRDDHWCQLGVWMPVVK